MENTGKENMRVRELEHQSIFDFEGIILMDYSGKYFLGY